MFKFFLIFSTIFIISTLAINEDNSELNFGENHGEDNQETNADDLVKFDNEDYSEIYTELGKMRRRNTTISSKLSSIKQKIRDKIR